LGRAGKQGQIQARLDVAGQHGGKLPAARAVTSEQHEQGDVRYDGLSVADR
jgi:hypothetical protein